MSLVRFKNQRAAFPTAFNRFFNDDFLFTHVKQVGHHTPAVNVKEQEDGFSIEVAAPGLTKEDFKVKLEEAQLVISAEVKKEAEEKEETTSRYTRKEFNFQSFRRVFNLPETIDVEGIAANYENGILSIHLPKKEEVLKDTQKEIAIQ